MNKRSARNVREFTKIVRDDQDGTIVRVPGHSGRIYFVRVKVDGCSVVTTCRRQGGQDCLGNSNGHICYHSIAAVATVLEGVAWCKSLSDAHNRANLGGAVCSVISSQGRGQAWAVAVVEDHVFDLLAWADELENICWWDATLARKIKLYNPAVYSASRIALEQLLEKYPERRKSLTGLFPQAVLKIGRNLLRGEEAVEI